jgi:hypothetical protein
MILRKAVVQTYFGPELMTMGYVQLDPQAATLRLRKEDVLELGFDVVTGSEYPDGDEWVIVEYTLIKNVNLPDELKSREYFSRVGHEGRQVWRHRELVRYRQGKVKRLEEALAFIDRKTKELTDALVKASVIKKKVKKSNS